MFFFSKNCVFPQIWWAFAHFDRSILFFDRSKIFNYVRESLCLFRSIELFSNCFDRVSVRFDRSRLFFDRSKLVKNFFLKRSECLFQIFSTFSLSPTWLRLHQRFFVVFFRDFARFLSFKTGKSLLPFLLHFISCFHAFFMHCIGYFRHFLYFGVFDDSNLFW